MKLSILILSALTLVSTPVFAAERIVIKPLMPATGKILAGVKKSEQVTVSGTLQIVPMGGAMVTVQSNNYGSINMFRPWEIDASLEKRLQELEASQVTVKVTGRLNTVCSEKQLSSDTLGCREFDTTKTIVIRTH